MSIQTTSTRKKDAPWIRKGIVGDFKNHLTQEQIDRMDQKWKENGAKYGIENIWD